MDLSISDLCRKLVLVSIARPLLTLAIALAVVAILGNQAGSLSKEVGYASYFGPDDPRIARLSRFLDEFQTGAHVIVVFSCRETRVCDSLASPAALDVVSRLQMRIESLPHVRRTWSILNTQIVDGPLSVRTVGRRSPTGEFELAEAWQETLLLARSQALATSSVISADGLTAGIVVELESIESEPMRASVRKLMQLRPEFEAELGATVYMAGDPVWTVISSDSIDRDSNLLTGLMFVVMILLLWLLFRDVWLSLLPVVSVGALFLIVQGLTGVLGMPVTSILAALPPVIVVIAMATSIHFVSAFIRATEESSGPDALLRTAETVGPGCFWSVVTTAMGFASFGLSDLVTVRHFGILAAMGVAASFVVVFTLLPCLLWLRVRGGSWQPRRPQLSGPSLAPETAFGFVSRAPRIVLAGSLLVLAVLLLGLPRLQYASDVGFGEGSYLFRSLSFIESNLRRPMTTEVAISIPKGRFIHDRESLELIHRVEQVFEEEPTTGEIWSILDLLSEAHRADRGHPPASFEDLVDSASREIGLVAALEQAPAFWSVTVEPDDAELHRARVSVDRGWLDDRSQAPYVARVLRKLADLEAEYAAAGYRIDLEGGLPLANEFVERLRDTQRTSFLVAFLIVSLTLLLLLRRDAPLLGWSIAANVLPVLALIGLMGWLGIGVDPANTMVGAILLVIAVDDTIHVALRYGRERTSGADVRVALHRTYASVGGAVVVSTICLAVGFSVLVASEWPGLRSFGMLASLGVVLALLADLLLLPAGLMVTAGWRSGAWRSGSEGAVRRGGGP